MRTSNNTLPWFVWPISLGAPHHDPYVQKWRGHRAARRWFPSVSAVETNEDYKVGSRSISKWSEIKPYKSINGLIIELVTGVKCGLTDRRYFTPFLKMVFGPSLYPSSFFTTIISSMIIRNHLLFFDNYQYSSSSSSSTSSSSSSASSSCSPLVIYHQSSSVIELSLHCHPSSLSKKWETVQQKPCDSILFSQPLKRSYSRPFLISAPPAVKPHGLAKVQPNGPGACAKKNSWWWHVQKGIHYMVSAHFITYLGELSRNKCLLQDPCKKWSASNPGSIESSFNQRSEAAWGTIQPRICLENCFATAVDRHLFCIRTSNDPVLTPWFIEKAS